LSHKNQRDHIFRIHQRAKKVHRPLGHGVFGLRDEMEESIQAEDEENQPQQYSRDDGEITHNSF
jgi:hypothetical protein